MDAPALQVYCGDTTINTLPVRGVAWVLRSTAALLVFVFASLVLTSFAYQIAAERVLRQAAAAGLREAALPRATSESVESAVRRSMTANDHRLRAIRFRLDRGGVPVRGAIAPANDGPLTIRLSAAADELAPSWLSFLGDEIAVSVRSVSTL
jgi:hypothetical protein